MKNLKSLFLAVAVIAMPFAFTSCGETEDGVTPEIVLVSMTETETGHTAILTVTCPPEGRLNAVTAEVVFNNRGSNQQVPRNNIVIAEVSQQLWTVTIVFPAMAGNPPQVVEYLRVTAETRDGGNVTREFEVGEDEPGPIATPLSAPYSFVLGNPANNTDGNPQVLFGIRYVQNPDASNGQFEADRIVLTPAEFNTLNTTATREALADFAEERTFLTDRFLVAPGTTNRGHFIIRDGETLRLVSFDSLAFSPGNNRANFTERH